MKRIIIALLAITVMLGCQEKKKSSRLNFHFASLEEGQKTISTSDGFTQNLHTFDLVSRLQDLGMEPSEENYLKLCKSSVQEWTEKEKQALQRAAERLQRKIDSCGYILPLPYEIHLIKTSMVEEGGAGGYTRGACIFLASCENLDPKRESFLDFLLAHELFHVMTRYCPEFRKEMYAQIGFNILDQDIKFSDQLLEMRISNPDVNKYDSYSIFEIGDKKVPCTMWFYNDSTYNGGAFFTYGKPGLIPLNEQFEPIMNEDGSPIIYKLDEAKDFFRLIGKNTGYIINPEEALADNFSFALTDVFPKGQKSPEVTERLRKVMKGSWRKETAEKK